MEDNMMLTRQKILIYIISKANNDVSKFQLVKWSFLLAKEMSSPHLKTFYQFVPYQYGPFSFTLYHELNKLIGNGYLLSNNNKLKELQNSNTPKLNCALQNTIDNLIDKFSEISDNELQKFVYNKFPWYTVNAAITGNRLLERPTANNAIYMMGYEGLHVDEFLDIIMKNGIKQLIDVRNNPISRRYGFHKSTLSNICQKLNINYKHFPQLGIPSSLRADLNNFNDYQNLFDQYENIILPDNKYINVSSNLINSTPSVLICSEKNPKYCHRYRLAKKIKEQVNLPIIDLRDERQFKACTQKQKSLLR